MEEYTDLATNGPYGYGPDVIYQANDQIMTYAEDKHILPVEVDKLDCYEQIPEIAWDAYRIVVDGKTYYCGVPVNIQEPMLFYREDMLPENWQTNWDKDGNGTPDFFENWNDLYAYSESLRECDTSATGTENMVLCSLYMTHILHLLFIFHTVHTFLGRMKMVHIMPLT